MSIADKHNAKLIILPICILHHHVRKHKGEELASLSHVCGCGFLFHLDRKSGRYGVCPDEMIQIQYITCCMYARRWFSCYLEFVNIRHKAITNVTIDSILVMFKFFALYPVICYCHVYVQMLWRCSGAMSSRQ